MEDVVHVRGHNIDLDVVYRGMLARAELQDGRWVFTEGLKYLLADLLDLDADGRTPQQPLRDIREQVAIELQGRSWITITAGKNNGRYELIRSGTSKGDSGTRAAATYLLTYNPAKWHWDPEERKLAVLRTRKGQLVADRWSTGSRNSGIAPGDRAVLLLQGRGARGLIARGVFTSTIYQDLHWDGSGRDANYARVNWDLVLDDGDLIPLEQVAALTTTVPWNNVQGSGIVVPPPGDAALETTWPTPSRTSAYSNSGPARGQSWQQDPVRRKQVEDYAQQLLEDKYRNEHWAVEGTRHNNPYDAVARKGPLTKYVEAKGTESDGTSVLVTSGEVEWARRHPGECVVGVVSGIGFDAAGNLDATSGTLKTYEWDPNTGGLKPLTYKWTPPPA